MAARSEANARASVIHSGAVAVVEIVGIIDETFTGFGDLPEVRFLVLDVGGVTRMTSFGVARWLAALEKIPRTVTESYWLRCPTIFVDQLNMVLGFGRNARVITFFAPYLCPSCGAESVQLIDVVENHGALTRGVAPDRICAQCSAAVELDESAESFFSFVGKHGATAVSSEVARVLEQQNRYRTQIVAVDKPPRVIKLVHNAVTYFRLIGSIGEAFRARPFLVGAEGEVVLDLAELEGFDPSGLPEWKRLLKSLSAQVESITIVDVSMAALQIAGESLSNLKNVAVASLLAPFRCGECGRYTPTSQSLIGKPWPLSFKPRVCPHCGGTSTCELSAELLAPLSTTGQRVPEATQKTIRHRTELVSRAVTDANVANAGDASPTQSGELILGKYKILRPLSAGGMADVFLANQLGIGGFEKAVALKRIQRKLLESRQMAVDMFLNEAKIAGRLTHPNIVQVLDVGESGGALYLAMEYVRGKDLREVMKRQRVLGEPLSLAVACHIVREIARALHHAYWSKDMEGNRLAVVHRDVTPHNVILSFEGQIKLLDFGVAMSAVTEQATSVIVGKWAYMSPEHSSGGKLDHRSDLFSLGVIMYLLLTSNMPFPGANPREIVRMTREGAFVPVLTVRPDVPRELADLTARLLAIEPVDRPQTGNEVASTIEAAMQKHELSTSASQIAQLLSQLFAGDTGSPGAPPQPPMEDRDLTQKISGFAAGTVPSVVIPDESAERSPVTNSESLGPGSASLKPRAVTTKLVDDSVSLARSQTGADPTELYTMDPPGAATVEPPFANVKRATTAVSHGSPPPAQSLPPRAPSQMSTPTPRAPSQMSTPTPRAPTQMPTPRAATHVPPPRAPTQSSTRPGHKKPVEISATVAIVAFVVLVAALFIIFRYA